MCGVLRWTTVDGKCVLAVVDGPPVLDSGFETRFDLPVLDQVLDQVRETAGGVVGALRCGVQIGLATFSAGYREGITETVFHTFLPYSARVGIIGCFAISPNSFVFSHCIWIQHVVRDSRRGLGSCSHDKCFPLKLRRALQGAESSRVLNAQEKPQIHRARDVWNPRLSGDSAAQGSFSEHSEEVVRPPITAKLSGKRQRARWTAM